MDDIKPIFDKHSSYIAPGCGDVQVPGYDSIRIDG